MGWLYQRTPDNRARFVLGTTGTRPLVCIGLNPSTAAPAKLDRTMASVDKVAAQNGYDSFIMLNVYPLRATNPSDLPARFDVDLKAENERQIASTISGRELSIWAAWGALITRRSYLPRLLVDLLRLPDLRQCRWYSRGPVSKAGHPHHPLYVRDSEPLTTFAIDPYRVSLGSSSLP